LNLYEGKADMSRTNLVGALVLSLLVIAGAAQEKSTPQSKFVLSSPDAQLTAKVPEVYTANLFGCSGGNMSPSLQWTRTGWHEEFRRNAIRS
jgi:hypothetical protein